MALAAGTVLGPYEITVPIGAGGMGEVYRAHDRRLHRDVAVKVLPLAVAADRDRLRRFEQEAHAVAALNHPNILALYDIGEASGLHFIVSELLDGEPLRDKLAGGPLPARRAIDLAVQIARGLAAAHDKGIVHRDLKPENIFVTNDARVKILDFGLAKPIDAGQPGRAPATMMATVAGGTEPGLVLGTVGYMSPEQVRGESVDHRTDIFSFGAVLYELVSGRRAFKRDTAAETMTAILKDDPPELAGAGTPIPPGLERIVRRALEKSPGERFQSAKDLGFALDAVGGPSTCQPSVSSTAEGGSDPSRPPSPRWLWPPQAWPGISPAIAALPDRPSSRASRFNADMSRVPGSRRTAGTSSTARCGRGGIRPADPAGLLSIGRFYVTPSGNAYAYGATRYLSALYTYSQN